jgi:protein-S-isoprenylcysteine O-methyltransferase Ste14
MLVTDGFYRYVRHPLYTAGLVIIWLIPIMTWNLLALIIGLTAYIFFGIYFEERKLLQEFGESYREYRQHTPMLIPGLKFSRAKPKT